MIPKKPSNNTTAAIPKNCSTLLMLSLKNKNIKMHNVAETDTKINVADVFINL
jgi:hypothetical protein